MITDPKLPPTKPLDLANIIRLAILHGRGYPLNPDTRLETRLITKEDMDVIMSFDPEGVPAFGRLQELTTWALKNRNSRLNLSLPVITMINKNWEGQVQKRCVHPMFLWYGTTEWHKTPGYLLHAYDPEKGAERDFALADCDFRQVESSFAAHRDYIAQYLRGRGALDGTLSVLGPAAEFVEKLTGAILPGRSAREDRVVKLEKALGFYADKKNWETVDWGDCETPSAIPMIDEGEGVKSCDCGDTARKALGISE